MKKNIIGIILAILLFFSFTNSVKADCKNKGLFGCGSGYTQCNNPSTCCSSASECSQYNTSGCTQVGSNQTSCESSQPVTCSQQMPNAGNIRRWCCGTQADCDSTKAGVQRQIGNQLKQSQSQPSLNVHGNCGENFIDTAIGCIPVLGGQQDFVNFILSWAIGVGGGIAFLLIVYAGFMIMTSSGNPERLKAGQELLTAAISGIVLLIFSVFILNFIGVKIFGIFS